MILKLILKRHILYITLIVYILSTYPNDKHIRSINTKEHKLFCLIFTSNAKIYSNQTRIIHQTWAKDCDKHFFVTRVNETSLVPKYFDTPIPLLQPRNQTDDSYEKLTDRLYYTYMDIYKLYPDYDFYLKTDDDTFIFVDNLRDFLKDKNPNEPTTFGYDFKVKVDFGFPSGGAGFVLSREAVKRIATKLSHNYTYCPNSGIDDVDVAKCLRLLHVYPSNTLDDLGRQRFHPFDITLHYIGGYRYPPWIYNYSKHPVKIGRECCSSKSISFHYMRPEDVFYTYKIWNINKANGLSDDSNMDTIIHLFYKYKGNEFL